MEDDGHIDEHDNDATDAIYYHGGGGGGDDTFALAALGLCLGLALCVVGVVVRAWAVAPSTACGIDATVRSNSISTTTLFPCLGACCLMVPSCGDCPRFVAKHLSVVKDVVPACLVPSSGEFHGLHPGSQRLECWLGDKVVSDDECLFPHAVRRAKGQDSLFYLRGGNVVFCKFMLVRFSRCGLILFSVSRRGQDKDIYDARVVERNLVSF